MAPVGFEPTISAGERPQTYALDRAATGTSNMYVYCLLFLDKLNALHHCSSHSFYREHNIFGYTQECEEISDEEQKP